MNFDLVDGFAEAVKHYQRSYGDKAAEYVRKNPGAILYYRRELILKQIYPHWIELVPWGQRTPFDPFFTETKRQMEEWCEENIRHPYEIMPHIRTCRKHQFLDSNAYFVDADDLLLFKLRWCGR